MWSIVRETAYIVHESALYLLIGFALAGVLHVLLRRSDRFSQLLADRSGKSVALAAVLGAPLPLCSCSVLPAALSLRKQGASKGATTSFLISVPETDIVSILITYGLLGPIMAIARPIAAVITAIVTGLTVNLVDRQTEPSSSADDGSEALDHDHAHETYDPQSGPVYNALRFGFVEFFDDIAGSLWLGLLLGGVVTALLPALGIDQVTGGSWAAMLTMLVIGVPMYVCAAASTPIAVGLIAGGLSPGAALVFLLAGPATNAASLVVLAKQLGRTTLAIYVLLIAVFSLLAGFALDSLLSAMSLTIAPTATIAEAESSSPMMIAGTITFVALSWMSFRRTRAFGKALTTFNRVSGLGLSPQWARGLVAVVVIAAYLSSGVFIVRVGHTAYATQFGRITQADLGPGVYYRWPYPFGGTVDTWVDRVRRLEIGYRSNFVPQQETLDPNDPEALTQAGPPITAEAAFAAESDMCTGDEDIVRVRWVVHYRVADSSEGAYNYAFRLADPERLVRAAAESALRTAIAARSIDTLLTSDRARVESEIAELHLQPILDRCDAGVRIVGVSLLDIHAPPEVHAAFRDVASADEDRVTTINMAWEYAERAKGEAGAAVAERLAQAASKSARDTLMATGEANAFLDRAEAFRQAPALNQFRMTMETNDAVLPAIRKIVRLPGASLDGLDVWVMPNTDNTPNRGILPAERRGSTTFRRNSP